jgi:hypothetical protein
MRWCERSSEASSAGAWRPNSLWPSQWQQRQPPCCSWDSAAYASSPLCPQGAAVQAAVRSAFEIGAGRFQARPDQLLPVGGNACACDPARREQLSLLWEPSGCRLRDFSASAFCTALGDRTLLLVGDSTMQQLASVLMNGLAWEEAQAHERPHTTWTRALPLKALPRTYAGAQVLPRLQRPAAAPADQRRDGGGGCGVAVSSRQQRHGSTAWLLCTGETPCRGPAAEGLQQRACVAEGLCGRRGVGGEV